MNLSKQILVILFDFVGFSKGSAIQWPFSNKVSAVPQFMSFKVAQEDKNKKILSDHLGSSGFMPFSAEAYEHNQRRGMAEVQVWHYLSFVLSVFLFIQISEHV